MSIEILRALLPPQDGDPSRFGDAERDALRTLVAQARREAFAECAALLQAEPVTVQAGGGWGCPHGTPRKAGEFRDSVLRKLRERGGQAE
jgi:hypothetical protein